MHVPVEFNNWPLPGLLVPHAHSSALWYPDNEILAQTKTLTSLAVHPNTHVESGRAWRTVDGQERCIQERKVHNAELLVEKLGQYAVFECPTRNGEVRFSSPACSCMMVSNDPAATCLAANGAVPTPRSFSSIVAFSNSSSAFFSLSSSAVLSRS